MITLYMKYFFIFIIVSTCVGCAGSFSSYKGEGGPFTIDTDEELLYNSYILSIRDSGLIVVQASKSSSLAIDTLDAFYIPNSKIHSLKHHGLSGLDAGGVVGGYLLGGIGLGLLGYSLSVVTDSPVPFQVGFIVGVYGGMVVGGLLAAPQSSFDIKKFNDRELLFLLCKYCGHEPEAIKKIK